VQVLERQKKFGAIKPTTLLVETLFSLQMVEELSSIHKAENVLASDAKVTWASDNALTPAPSTISVPTGN
jgi:hypothetical protein